MAMKMTEADRRSKSTFDKGIEQKTPCDGADVAASHNSPEQKSVLIRTSARPRYGSFDF